MDYWYECISEAFDDAKITATDDQINTVAAWVEGAHDNYSTALGYDSIPNPLLQENKVLLKEIQKEREKIICPECLGKGIIICNGPVHSSMSSCCKCNGEGRYNP